MATVTPGLFWTNPEREEERDVLACAWTLCVNFCSSLAQEPRTAWLLSLPGDPLENTLQRNQTRMRGGKLAEGLNDSQRVTPASDLIHFQALFLRQTDFYVIIGHCVVMGF